MSSTKSCVDKSEASPAPHIHRLLLVLDHAQSQLVNIALVSRQHH